MLQINEIRKQYITGELVQTALDGVSLTLRDHEFVAILGPSGSGKTTLLNVIGGLDRYDTGDLIINGISTKKYSDRDWDSYRNHTIGFVFQSYNLIPHQTVLANVELALTISGISRAERRRRAIQALEAVGLGNQLHKRPNQMSGGQMQRVAIARALVNNPDILLADEPTGALDSDTSIQVMDLLKEVSRDRLVVMVTHNPELAEEYATRIVRLRDGRIIGDTNPYFVEETLPPPAHKNMGKSSMSFLTALVLSFNNLRTKKARTLLTAFAGSIGIIGIALIMSLSTGFQKYIDKIQEDTLSNYPLTIQSETADMTGAMAVFASSQSDSQASGQEAVMEQQIISQMFAQVGSNDLGSFKAHLEENYDQVAHTINSVQYAYGIKPRIFSADLSHGVRQVNPGTLFSQLTGSSIMSSYMDSDVFQEMNDNIDLLEAQYQILRGRWPESYNELVLVLSQPNQLTDYIAYTLGLRDCEALLSTIEKVMSGQEAPPPGEAMSWTYDQLMALQFRLVDASSLYRYNSEYNVWEDMSSDTAYMRDLVEHGELLSVVGIVCPKDGVTATALTPGVAYTSDLTHYVIQTAAQSELVQQQLARTSIDVFTGKPFGAKDESALNFQDMISVDSDRISSAFGMNMDESTIASLLESYLQEAAGNLNVDTAPAHADFTSTLNTLATGMLQDFVTKNGDPATGTATLRLSDAESLVDGYLATDAARSQIRDLASRYEIPTSALNQVYRPLLLGLVAGYIAAELPAPELETPTLPDITDPTSPPEAPEPTQTVPPALSQPSAAPTEPRQETEAPPEAQTPPETEPPAETEPPTETQPPAETELPTETQPPAETEPPTETQPPAETEPPTETQPSAETEPPAESEPPAETEPPGTEPPAVTLPEIDIGPDDIWAPISQDSISSFVSEFTASSLVSGTAAVMAGQMMEASVRRQLMAQLSGFGYRLMSQMGSSFTVDQEKLAAAFQFNMNEEELRRLMEAMSTQNQEPSAEQNLRALGYADLDEPISISFYLMDFAAKEEFMEFLDRYNASMEEAQQDEQVIRYTDITGIMMSSVRTIVDSVSYVLIAFVAVSLIVSSIMIGIITYISVMERTKEIGVLRAIGASKRNISQVFNAETFIIGLCSGLMGIGITLLLLIPCNYLIHTLTGNSDITALLPTGNAAVLVILSMLLTIIGGLIPSKKAALKDPVIALRSE